MYVPVNVSNGKGREEMWRFWKYMNECLRSFRRSRIMLIGDMNRRVCSNEVAGVVGRGAVSRWKKSEL